MSKAGRNKIIKWSILGLLLAYSAVISIWAHNEAASHVCTGIEVEVAGHHAMDSLIARGVREELRDYPGKIVGSPLHQLSTIQIEKFLNEQNNFEEVHCMISSRGQLVVKVTPLIPVMRVFFGDNSYYINKDGKYIDSNAEFYTDVPIVTGRFSSRFTPKDVIPLVNYVSKDPILSELVAMINAEGPNNLILVPRIRGHVVNFGDTLRLDEKKRALTMFYRQVMPYKGWNEYDTISVKFRGQIVATRRDKSQLNHAEQYEEEEDMEEATLPDRGDNMGAETGTGTGSGDENNTKPKENRG